MSQEKLKTKLMQNFGGQTRCIMGDVKVANKNIFEIFYKILKKCHMSSHNKMHKNADKNEHTHFLLEISIT